MNIDTRELQLELLKMMKIFHKVCVDNKLTYYMLGGTCLGAIRHQGFIPWDDDMDIGMPRNDYDLFCEKFKEYLPHPLELRYYCTVENSPFHFAKLINANTTLIEPRYQNYIEGIYIDIFPLDGMTEYNFFNKIRSKKIWFIHACIANHCSTENKKDILHKFFQKISKHLDLNKLHILLQRLMIAEKNKTPMYLCNFLGAWKQREFIPFKVFGKPVLYHFEDTQLFGPENPDCYLRSLYDDYMKLPPKEKQVCRHDYYYVNLKLPYQDYLK